MAAVPRQAGSADINLACHLQFDEGSALIEANSSRGPATFVSLFDDI
jgi:hypothetical protein